MKNQLTLFSSLIVASTLFFSSCSVEKKLYSLGYHVEWNESKQHKNFNDVAYKENNSIKSSVVDVVVKEEKDKNETGIDPTLTASTDKAIIIVKTPYSKSIKQKQISTKAKQILVQQIATAKQSKIQQLVKVSKTEKVSRESKSGPSGTKIFLYILCIFPPLAVFVATNRFEAAGAFGGKGSGKGSVKTWYLAMGRALLALLLTILFYIPGVLYAIWIIFRCEDC